ncbi:DUF3533 domain-containing protein [Streptomyces sp. NPDC046805]|uniref:YhgE/Pip domain-containing protein n=1 Tax=Streptomyces sp. NPDC046805 TaxID=3155134 RepID=UPI00340BD978
MTDERTDEESNAEGSASGTGPRSGAVALLGRPKLWLMPTILTTLLALFLSLLYMGGIVNPNRHLRDLPIALVNGDRGNPLPGQRQNLGTQLARAVVSNTSGTAAVWRPATRAQAQNQMASGKVYGALVIPADFTQSVAALTTTHAHTSPTLTVLTNPGKGSLGSSISSQISTTVAQQASRNIGKQLTAAAARNGADSTTRLLLADPVRIDTKVGYPIGNNSGLGLSAFYYTLLLVLAGFLGGNLLHSSVDGGLGYADVELGPWHSRRPTVLINRTQTLLLKLLMTAGISVISASLIMVVCVVVLGMDASHPGLLWIYSYCAVLAVGVAVQAINAAFGGIGQLVSMFAFIALGLPSSGATVPLEALPGFYRFLSIFEPMRQLSDGVRAILYFDARGDAGLDRAWTMMAIGGAISLIFGFAMTSYYDRAGLRRSTPRPA